MILAIVGSTCADFEECAPIIVKALETYKPRAIISGGAMGVDSFAERLANSHKIPAIVCKPAAQAWQYFKPRNILIAELCDRLVRIASRRSKTFGSGWTMQRAVKLGKPVEEFWVD